MVNRLKGARRRRLDRLGMDAINGAGQGDQGTGTAGRFVSPDGKWVAEAKQKELWKVPVEGGSVAGRQMFHDPEARPSNLRGDGHWLAQRRPLPHRDPADDRRRVKVVAFQRNRCDDF